MTAKESNKQTGQSPTRAYVDYGIRMGFLETDGRRVLYAGKWIPIPDGPDGEDAPAPLSSVGNRSGSGEVFGQCGTCGGSGQVVRPMTSIGKDSAPGHMACEYCRGSGRTIGRPATLSELDSYKTEKCSVIDRIFELAKQGQQTRTVAIPNGQITLKPSALELLELVSYERHGDTNVEVQEQSAYHYRVLLLPSGEFRLTRQTHYTYETSTMLPWHTDGGWGDFREEPLSSIDDILILFDFVTYFSWGYTNHGGHGYFLGSHTEGRPKVSIHITRKHQKGSGLLTRLEELFSPEGIEKRAQQQADRDISSTGRQTDGPVTGQTRRLAKKG